MHFAFSWTSSGAVHGSKMYFEGKFFKIGRYFLQEENKLMLQLRNNLFPSPQIFETSLKLQKERKKDERKQLIHNIQPIHESLCNVEEL